MKKIYLEGDIDYIRRIEMYDTIMRGIQHTINEFSPKHGAISLGKTHNDFFLITNLSEEDKEAMEEEFWPKVGEYTGLEYRIEGDELTIINTKKEKKVAKRSKKVS